MMRTAYNVLATSLLMFTVLGVSPVLSAHGNDDGHDAKGSDDSSAVTEQQGSSDSAGYSFITPEGGSMSVLTRRAIQLFDEADNSLSLTPAQAAYVEATLVQELGNRYLEIGERFTVPRDRLAIVAKQSLTLDSATIASWQEYASETDFAVSQVSPEKQPVATTDNNKPETTQIGENDTRAKDDNEDNRSVANRTSWGIFLAILAVSAGVYAAQLRRKSSDAIVATKPTRKNAAPRKSSTPSRKRKK